MWEIRIRLQLANNTRELALFNLAIDSKLRSCDLVKLKVRNVTEGLEILRRTKATQIYKRTKNIRAVQLLLGHSKLESTFRYQGIDVDDALEIAENTEV